MNRQFHLLLVLIGLITSEGWGKYDYLDYDLYGDELTRPKIQQKQIEQEIEEQVIARIRNLIQGESKIQDSIKSYHVKKINELNYMQIVSFSAFLVDDYEDEIFNFSYLNELTFIRQNLSSNREKWQFLKNLIYINFKKS